MDELRAGRLRRKANVSLPILKKEVLKPATLPRVLPEPPSAASSTHPINPEHAAAVLRLLRPHQQQLRDSEVARRLPLRHNVRAQTALR